MCKSYGGLGRRRLVCEGQSGSALQLLSFKEGKANEKQRSVICCHRMLRDTLLAHHGQYLSSRAGRSGLSTHASGGQSAARGCRLRAAFSLPGVSTGASLQGQ